MRRFWIFRSNLRILENYYNCKNLEDFKSKCWDFYLLQGLWYLENGYFDEFVVFRLGLKGSKLADIIFDINSRKFIQRWVNSFKEVYRYPSPDISFFRGGFPQYDEVVRENPRHFGKTLYLGAGKRLFPQYGGKYDTILLESELDFNNNHNCSPFYKTANPNIFKPLNINSKKYDLCWPNNFSQIRYKGQQFFISSISKSKLLRSLKIVHCGNSLEVGNKLCKKYNVNNIEFKGWLERPELNKLLNQSKFGIVTSNQSDGCPRISTEILTSGTPLLIRNQTRILDHYKENGVVEFDDINVETKIKEALLHHTKLHTKLLSSLEKFSFDIICKKNWKIWTKKSR